MALPARINESSGTTIYVSRTGSNANPGTIGSPKLTVTGGILGLTNGVGGIVLVRGGFYPELVENWNIDGASNNPVTVMAYEDEPVTIGGEVNLYEPYLRFRKLRFRYSSGRKRPGMYLQHHTNVPADNVELDECILEYSCQDGVFLEGGATAGTRINNFQMHRCIVRRNGRSATLEHGFYPKWATNWVVSDSLLELNSASAAHLGNASDGGILANSTLIAKDGIEALVYWSEAAGERSDNNVVRNCIVYQITGGKDAVETTWGGGSAGTGNSLDHSVVDGGNGINIAAGGLTVGGDVVEEDPLFVDLTARDYRVYANSPAVGLADPDYESEVDLLGVPRTSGTVGAYGTAVPVPTNPSIADRNKLITLGVDIVDSWYAGTSDEFYNPATRIWNWNTTEAGNNNDWDQRIGLSSLCAALSRYRKPLDVNQRMFYRRLATETIDQWFINQQDPVTGGIWRTAIENLVSEQGTVTFFGLSQVALVAKLLGLRTRWATQIGRALDYSTSRGELGYYTNGNIMFLKLVSYELGAWATGEQDRRDDVETLWEFTQDPETQQAGEGFPNRWRGCGFIDEGNGKGYYSETTSTGNSIDHTGTNRLDWIYTDAQANYASLGYLLYGDPRYAAAALACSNKMKDRYDFEDNQFEYSGGSRNAGPGVRNITGPAIFDLGWVQGNGGYSSLCSDVLNTAVTGVDADFRNYLNQTHVVFARAFGLTIAASFIAAHGTTLEGV